MVPAPRRMTLHPRELHGATFEKARNRPSRGDAVAGLI